MKEIVLVTIPAHPATLDRLRARHAGLEIRLVPEPLASAGEAVDWPVHEISRAHVLLCSGAAPRNFKQMKSLRWVQLGSAGYEPYTTLDLPARGIRLTNAAGVFDTPIAEWNIAMMVNLARDLRAMVRNQDAGAWDRDARFQRDIRGG